MKVLIVEDETRLAEAIHQILLQQKYLTDVVNDGQSGLDYALDGNYDVILLDVMLPKMNGFDVVKHLRKNHIATPVLLLTARDEITDKVTGLDCGADDYMTKPFSPEELLARIRALSRRQGEVVIDELTFEDLTLNITTLDLICQTKSIHLGYKEFEIMKLFLSYPKLILSKEELISKVWGDTSDAEDNNVEAYISFLRKKLSYLNSCISINTLRKIGYRLEVAPND